MDRLKRDAILAELADKLRRHGSWCGETHLQKSVYFLQEQLRVPTEFTFILYKHGPFSFELRDEITSMRADGMLELIPQYPYGPRLIPTDRSIELRKKFPKTLDRHMDRIEFVSVQLGNKDVSELEKLATALFVRKVEPFAPDTVRTHKLVELKPHVSSSDAERVTRLVDEIARASEALVA
ncbi:MAG: hypothetical protein ACRD5F_05615 [Candidatus Acidiferrales bacterium]